MKNNVLSKISSGLLFLFISLMQFYVFSSGSLQPSYIAGLAFVLVMFVSTGAVVQTSQPIKLFYAYVGYAALVDLSYAFLLQSEEFLGSTLYMTYNLLLFTALIAYLQRNADKLQSSVVLPSFLALVLLVSFYFTGIGRYDFRPRYNGFFNDPNQMAHFALCIMCVIWLVGTSNKVKYIAAALTLVICVVSASRSSLLGLSVALIGITWYMYREVSSSSKFIQNVSKLTFVIVLSALVYYLFTSGALTKIQAVSYLLDRTAEINVSQQSDGRGFTQALDNWDYMFFGAGQGLLTRFGMPGEIHSNWIGTLFYYGLPGLFFVVFFLFSMIRKLPLPLILISLSPLLYGFTTYGLRTPVFYLYAAALFIRSNQSNTRCR